MSVPAAGDATHALALVLEAAAFAADRHRDQRRKDVHATPYINHPLQVAHVLAFEGGVTDVTTIAAAILHDTIEDTETTPEELERTFGAAIAGVVAEVTDDKTFAKERRKALQIEHAPHLSQHAKAVKLADKICNIRDVAERPPHGWSLHRRQEYFDWAKAVVDGLRGSWPELERAFDRAYAARPQ